MMVRQGTVAELPTAELVLLNNQMTIMDLYESQEGPR